MEQPMNMQYKLPPAASIIGRSYKYHGSRHTTFIVKRIIEGCIVEFECGHRVTDSVFMDLWDVEARKYNYTIFEQLKMF